MIKKYLNLDKYRAFIVNRIPNIFQELTRNYDTIILGDYAIVKTILEQEKKKEKVLDLSNYFRNYYTDMLIIQRYYSLARKGGTVEIYMNVNDKKYFEKKNISPFDYGYLHPVTLMEQGVKPNSFFHKLNMVFNGIRYMRAEKKDDIFCEKNVKESFAEKFSEIVRFCEERNLYVSIKGNDSLM